MAGPIRISILANGRQARTEATLTARTYGGLGRTLAKVGAAAGLTALTAKAIGFAASSVKLEAAYSQTMATIQSATGATDRAMGKLNEQALKLGADTSFSASDAADAMLDLAKAGVSTKNIMGGGVAGTLQLAAAGGTELGTAATIASNAMNAFNLGGTKMNSIAAALAGGANASSASVESLGQALSQVGPGAVNAGLNLQETVAALAAFDNAGIKGSDAGTSLKTMLARLVPQTTKAKDAMKALGLDFVKGNGEFKSLANISAQLHDRLGKLSQAQRVAALNTIFGSDASRAATVLMREGADGIRKYTKASKDQTAAEKMAAARMSGTAGSLERLSGAVETAQLRLGQELAPTVQQVSDALADNAVPAMEGTIDVAKTLAKALTPLASVLKDVGEGALTVGGFVGDLPGPVKEVGIQAGLAALILPRLSAGVTSLTSSLTLNIARLQQWRAEMTYSATRAQATAAVMTRLGGAAKAAAGVGGMVALTQASQQSNKAVGGLLTTLGGAATGFALGGPIGALIGGGAGGILGLYSATRKSHEETVKAMQSWQNYASTLDQVTGATTRATRMMAIQALLESGALKNASELGLSRQSIISATLGEDKARRQVIATLEAQQKAVNALIVEGSKGISSGNQPADQQRILGEAAARQKVIDAIKAEVGETSKAISQKATELALTNKIPRRLVTQFQSRGLPESVRDVRRLVGQFSLTPRQVRTVFKMADLDLSRRQVQRLSAELGKTKPVAERAASGLRKVGAVKPDVAPWLKGLEAALTSGKQKAGRGAEGVAKALGQGTGKARANLSGFNTSLSQGITTARTSAASGGKSTGNALGSGMYNGVDIWGSPIAARAAAIVRAAVAAARRAADAHSPSRETDRLGRDMGQGLANGLDRSRPKAKTAGQKLALAVRAGIVDGTEGLDRAWDATTRLIDRTLDQQLKARQKSIRKRLDGKAESKALAALDKAWSKHGKTVAKSLRDEHDALTKNAKAQDVIAHKLENAVQGYKRLVQQSKEYATSIRESITGSGSISTLGQGNGFGSVAQLVMQRGAAIQQAKKWAAAIKKLRAMGLNEADLRDLIAQGPSSLPTALAIIAAGKGSIKTLNSQNSQLTAIGKGLGDWTAQQFYGAGIQSAKGLVDGLESQGKELDKAGIRLANALVKAVKKALGIKSPSRVFANLGVQTSRGLQLGIKAQNTHVKRAGASMASAVESGYRTPALDAYRTSAGSAEGRLQVALTLTAEQRDQLERGRAIRLDLDAWDGLKPSRKSA